MVVDDSAVIRGLLTRSLEADHSIKVIASVGNGEVALKTLGRHDIEVIILDIEMPVMDGLTALPKLLAAQPGVKVVMASALTRKNAEVSLRALQAGAADYVTKPSSTSELTSADNFQRELTEKVKALAAATRSAPKAKPAVKPVAGTGTGKAVARQSGSLYGGRDIVLRKAPIISPRVIAIGSSTGGPQALLEVLVDMTATVKLPILITQHMPATFTTLLAEHIGRASGVPTREAVDGDQVEAGHIYLAPGNYHMVVEASGASSRIRLNQNPQENFCRPAVDPMLRSMAAVYGAGLLTVILTGMGSDGQKGASVVVEAGGSVIAQDEATSVVWGMPGAVATSGLCSAVLPLKEIGPSVRKMVMRSAA
ncbi:chemotaxis response regulator protein-glutamate methylesterase [Pelagibius litoralis]|uniref:Protein-glutamate methylesterase/protein-glutamine glutaminase n=2 Tax=Pelagibius litoralis TaxID=374515 RepID=A0A967KFC0_9PROT|nr:chemotaxis response regulator protein-glutamate methylesterase [Pelagibius litoralis]